MCTTVIKIRGGRESIRLRKANHFFGAIPYDSHRSVRHWLCHEFCVVCLLQLKRQPNLKASERLLKFVVFKFLLFICTVVVGTGRLQYAAATEVAALHQSFSHPFRYAQRSTFNVQQTPTMQLSSIYLIALALVASTAASSGDRSGDFQHCVIRCSADACTSSSLLPISLRITRWTCTDDCKYRCMHSITDLAIERGDPVQQYYGKWPFWRLVGMQEPASVAFSLLNLWCHAHGGNEVLQRIPSGHPMKSYYLIWSLLSVNAWTWSSVFHTRGRFYIGVSLTDLSHLSTDFPLTEKLDYFSAALAIGYGLYYTVIRMFHLYPRRDTLSTYPTVSNKALYFVWTLLCILVYLTHISYLTLLPRFDYTYNIAFNLTLGLSHNALWLLYSLPAVMSLIRRFPSKPKSYRPRYASKAAAFVVLTTVTTALEVFDFPPWARVIDAHALWHLATAPIAIFWYRFLVEDALDEGWRGHKA